MGKERTFFLTAYIADIFSSCFYHFCFSLSGLVSLANTKLIHKLDLPEENMAAFYIIERKFCKGQFSARKPLAGVCLPI